jgi:hypothetical protein
MKNKQQKHIQQLSTLWAKMMSLTCSSLGRASLSSLVGMIQEVDQYNLKSGQPYLLPKTKVPNIKKFRIKITSPYHPILAKAGINKRQFNPLIEAEKYHNGRINRYLNHQFIRLNKNKHRPLVYWRICEHMLNRSDAYLTLLMHNVYPQWHRKRSYGSVWRDVWKFRKLDLRDYRHTELPFPKGDGTYRYLGIPRTYWRLYLHGLQQFLQIFLRPYDHPWQHGYQHSKGTGTAWKQILKEVIHSPNIYEFDLRKYFDTINLDYLSQILTGMQLPAGLVSSIILWSRTPASNSRGSRLQWESDSQRARVYKYHVTKEYSELSPLEEKRWLHAMSKAIKQDPHKGRFDYYHGVAQGSAISPKLSTLPLVKDLFNKLLCKVVQYADDGILYDLTDASPEEILQFPPESGIKVNYDKSRWIRKDGEWLRPLKFCGMIFDPFDTACQSLFHGGSLKNATRILKKYRFDHHKLIHKTAQYDWYYEKRAGKFPYTAEDWFKHKYFGLVVAWIYNGTFQLDMIRQDFSYAFKEYSWAYFEKKRKEILANPELALKYQQMYDTTKLNIFNSSSYCALALCKRIERQVVKKSTNGFVQ